MSQPSPEEIQRVREHFAIPQRKWEFTQIASMQMVAVVVVTVPGLLAVWCSSVIERPGGALAATSGVLATMFFAICCVASYDESARRKK